MIYHISIPPAQINRPGDTKPWANPKTIAPSIPCIVLLNAPIKYTAAWDTEL